jgi:isoquinoline 1-oxidoreductase beta subunit
VPSEVQVDERRMPRAAFAGRARADEFGFLDGSAVFGVDVRLPNLSTAAIVHSPIAGGAVRSVDATAALRSAGVVDVVRLDDAVAVVASDFWTASQALRKLRIEWTPPPTLPDTDRHRQALLAAVAAGQGMPVRGEREGSAAEQRRASERVMDAAHRRVEAVFYVPWAAHMTMEPQTATAHVADGRAELWLPTQSQAQVRSTVAELLKLPERAVTVNTTRVGGGFGRRLETDVAREATLIAQRVKRPVKLIWSREQDLHNDYFRPAAAARLRASLDANGDVSSLVFDVAAPSILASSSNTFTLPADEPDFSAIMGLAGGYRLPEPSIGWTRVEAGLRSGWWRSVGCSANTFFLESFIDELAAANGAPPLAYRRALLAEDARALRVLQALQEQVAASAPVAQDWFWGFSWLRYSGSRVAHAVAVSREGERAIRLRRIVVAVDCGVVVNPHFARSLGSERMPLRRHRLRARSAAAVELPRLPGGARASCAADRRGLCRQPSRARRAGRGIGSRDRARSGERDLCRDRPAAARAAILIGGDHVRGLIAGRGATTARSRLQAVSGGGVPVHRRGDRRDEPVQCRLRR